MTPNRILSLVLCVSLTFAAGFGTGWKVRAWKAGSDAAVVQKKIQADKDAQIAAKDAALAKADEAGRAVSAALGVKAQSIDSRSAETKKEIFHAQRKDAASGAVPCSFDADWVRLYNDALRPDRDPAQAASAPADPSAGAGGTVDGWDVQFVNAENGRRWAQCRANLNALIDFEETADLGADAAPVVTPSSRR